MRRLLLLTALVLFASPELSAQTVRIENADGYLFEVGPVSGRRALCTFRLPESSDGSLHQEKLPSMGIAGFEPQTVVAWRDPEEPLEDGGDFMEVARRSAGVAPLVRSDPEEVRFACWIGLPGQASPTRGVLRQVMDGEELRVDFTRDDGSSAGTEFPLDGARERIASTLAMTERPSETDYLQDDLLRLRVRYRSTTCYLLNHPKKRQQCLDAVNLCSQRSHESVVENIGCIELQ